MIQLRVLGGIVLQGDGNQVTGAAAQRHQLALLGFLAALPGQSASRDKLIAYLWPELETSRARHRLSVALHVLRRSLGESCIATPGDSVALNPGGIWTDVGAFQAAVAAGRLVEAAGLYAGPFLDGFSLNGAGEYERWVETERTRLARVYRATLEQLIAHETAAGDQTAAAGWWRLLAAHEPYSAPVAIGVVRALAAIGDLGGALRHARAHASLVQGHLEVPPDPTVLEIAEQLVREAKTNSDERSLAATSLSEPGSTAADTPSARLFDRTLRTEVSASPKPRSRFTPGRNLLGATLALAFFTAIAGWGLRRSGGESAAPNVAVLPFNSIGPVETRGWGDALAERVRANLAFVPGVEARTVAQSSPIDEVKDFRTIGHELNATTIIDGTLERREDSLIVTARLFDGRSGELRWTGTLGESGASDSSLLDKVAFVIADTLRLHVAPFEPHHYTSNDRAYDRFLQGVYSHRQFTRGDIWAALQLYREAYEEDTTFALAHAVSGNAYIDLTLVGILPEVAFPQAREHVLRSLALDSTLEEGHAALGFLQAWGDRDFEAGERSLIRAIMLHPTLPQARAWFGWYALYVRGWHDVGVSNIRKALKIDPLNTVRSHYVEWGLYNAGRYEEALVQHQVTWSLDVEVARSLTDSPLAASYRELGRYDEAIAEYEALQERTGVVPAGLAITYARMGRGTEARALLRDIEARTEDNGVLSLEVVRVYANLGDFDRAFQWLERAEAVRPDGMLGLKEDPALVPLRIDPRFQEWLHRIGLNPP